MKNVLRTLVFDKQVSLTLAETTDIVNEGIRLHELTPASAIVFGKAISAMTFASAALKIEVGEISLSMQCDGEVAGVGVSGNQALRLRGYIQNPFAEGDESACLGENGVLTIIRDDGYRRPFVGTSAFSKNSGIDGAFEEYYRTSEQLPTYIKTRVELEENGNCAFAGVAVLQPLPFAEDEVLETAAKYSLNELLDSIRDLGLEQTAKSRFDVDTCVWDMRKAEYKCNCSKNYLSRVLFTLGEEELRKIINEDGVIKVHCHYCNTDYAFVERDIDELFAKKE